MSREIKTLEACKYKVPRYLHRARELLNFYTEDYNLLFGIFIFSAVYLWTLLFFFIYIYHQLKLIFQAWENNLYSLFEEETP